MPPEYDQWRGTLQPVVRAISRDKRNFDEAFFPIDGTPWRLVINFVTGGDPEARARVEAVVPCGAPVEWREVKYSAAFFDRLMRPNGGISLVIGPHPGTVYMWGPDVFVNRLRVVTLGEQPEIEQLLTEAFGDAVLVEVGPAELPPPI